MPEPKTLRVLARGSAMVTDFEAQENPFGFVKRFIGRSHDPNSGEEVLDLQTKMKTRQGGFLANPGDVVTVPNRHEYRQALQHGNLWAADAETAQVAGVAFDPLFGGEHGKPDVVAAIPLPVIERHLGREPGQHEGETTIAAKGV